MFAGNYVGTDASGMSSLTNGGDGIVVYGQGNVIGVPGAGNVILGNALPRGIFVRSAAGHDRARETKSEPRPMDCKCCREIITTALKYMILPIR